MAATNDYLSSLKRQLLSLSIAATPAIAIADTELHPHQQWVCQPDKAGAWQCQQQSATPGAYPQAPAPRIIKAQRKATAAEAGANTLSSSHPFKQWDWVPKDQLADPGQCATGCDGAYQAPSPDWPESGQDPEQSPLRASAASSAMVGSEVSMAGNIVLSQGYRRLKADQASMDRNSHELEIDGNVEIREPDLLLRAQSANVNTNTGLGHFNNASFLQHSNGSRGQAKLITRNSADTLELEQGSITQCTPDDEVWSIQAGEIHIDNAEGWGSAKHARLNIRQVPVLYLPYMTFPIDDRRKSGFLAPTFARGDDNGIEINTPYYFNLAPNYDATLAPHYIAERGTMVELELRQLSRFGQWTLAGAQLNDEKYRRPNPLLPVDDSIPIRENRWLGSVDQQGRIFGINTAIDYAKVSDRDYFRDLSTDSLDIKRALHLNQQLELGYRNDAWQADVTVQQFQTIDDQLDQQYQLMPRVSLERHQSGANFHPEWFFQAEFTDFQHDQAIDQGGTFVTGQRAYAEAGASYPMRWAGGFIIPSAKVRNINYDLDAFNPGDDDSPSATAPLATLDMGLQFERSTSIGGKALIQTLEPRLYYFYSDYEQQGSHPDFDTRELNFSYSQLFRDTRFSGNDRLDDANQASVGISSRFIDDSNGREILTLSLGQIFYFEDRQVQLNGIGGVDSRSNSMIASSIQYQPYDQLWLTNEMLWDSRRDKLQEGGLGFHYQSDRNSLYNLGYRYRREGANNIGTGLRDLSQADASMVLPIDKHWSLFARYRYDIEENRSLDDLFGFQYEDCCWMLRLLYQQGLENEYELAGDTVVERDYAFILEFQLKGLGSLGSKARGILENNILGYEDLDDDSTQH